MEFFKDDEDGASRKSIFTKRMEICRSDMDRFRALETLKAKNRKGMECIGKFAISLQPYQVSSGKVIRVVDMYCKTLDLPLEIKMLSLELFERFMVTRFDEIMRKNSKISYRLFTENADSYEEQWQSVFDLAPLYLIACVQLASKYENRDLAMSEPLSTIRYLKRCGYETTVADLMEAEISVLSTIEFNIDIITRFSAVEDLICTRRNQDFIKLSEIVFGKSMEILEMLIKTHRKIFDETFHQLGFTLTASEKMQNRDLQMSEYDSLWIGAAAIVASIRLIRVENLTQDFADNLCLLVLKELADDLVDTRNERELRILSLVLHSRYKSVHFNFP